METHPMLDEEVKYYGNGIYLNPAHFILCHYYLLMTDRDKNKIQYVMGITQLRTLLQM